jgi:hypothetical protein
MYALRPEAVNRHQRTASDELSTTAYLSRKVDSSGNCLIQASSCLFFNTTLLCRWFRLLIIISLMSASQRELMSST